MDRLNNYLKDFEKSELKTRTTYIKESIKVFCIKRTANLITVGVPHRKEFAEYARKCGAVYVGMSKGSFSGWVTFDNEDNAIKFMKHVTEIRVSEIKRKS